MKMFSKKAAASTPLSEFIRDTRSSEKKKVYATVLERAADMQREVVDRVVGKTRRASG